MSTETPASQDSLASDSRADEMFDGEIQDGDAATTERKLGPQPLPRAPQRSLLLPAAFLFAVSAPALYTLSAATQHLSPWILIAYLFFVWAAGIALAFWRRRGLRPNSKTGWSARV